MDSRNYHKDNKAVNWISEIVTISEAQKVLNKAKALDDLYETEEIYDPIRKLTVIKKIKLKENGKENKD